MHRGGEGEKGREGESQQELSFSFLMALLAHASIFYLDMARHGKT
jgi:hypothetical protein